MSPPLCVLASLLNGDQSFEVEETITEDYERERRGQQSSAEQEKCQRFVFFASHEKRFHQPEFVHYFIASKLFYQNLLKIKNPDLPRNNVKNPWDALNSVVYIRNPKLEAVFEAMKAKFKSEGKRNAFGDVQESLLFYGTSNDILNKIIENNFSLEYFPKGELNLFGRGFYFSQGRVKKNKK